MFRKLLALGFIGVSLCQAEVDQATVKKVEDYLNGLTSYRARINQTNSNNGAQTGHVYMQRKGTGTYGKLRIEYDPPAKDLMVVDGKEFYYYDARAKETNKYDIDQTPASFLLRKKIDLRDDLTVTDIKKSEDSMDVRVVNGSESGGAMTLKFSTSPMLKLNGWVVTDPQGITTTVNLEDVNIGIDLDPSLFKYSVPKATPEKDSAE